MHEKSVLGTSALSKKLYFRLPRSMTKWYDLRPKYRSLDGSSRRRNGYLAYQKNLEENKLDKTQLPKLIFDLDGSA